MAFETFFHGGVLPSEVVLLEIGPGRTWAKRTTELPSAQRSNDAGSRGLIQRSPRPRRRQAKQAHFSRGRQRASSASPLSPAGPTRRSGWRAVRGRS